MNFKKTLVTAFTAYVSAASGLFSSGAVAQDVSASTNLQAPAAAETVGVTFGPFVGGGRVSTGDTVRQTNGYAIAVNRRFAIADRVSLGPVVEFSNSFVSLRGKDGTADILATYDNRIFAAGARLGVKVGNEHTLAQEAYLNAVVGRGFSKLAVDRSDVDVSYKQRLFNNISGNYAAAELGAMMPLKNSLGLTVAFNAARYTVDQSQAPGSSDNSEIIDGNVFLTSSKIDPKENGLPKTVVMTSMAVKIGFTLGF